MDDRHRPLTVDPDAAARVERAQGVYYLLTGIWPIVHMPSFLLVTGDKRERWLVRSYAALTCAVGASLLASSYGRGPSVLGPAAAASIAVPEAWYSARRRISWVYMADALLETGFLTAYVVARRR